MSNVGFVNTRVVNGKVEVFNRASFIAKRGTWHLSTIKIVATNIMLTGRRTVRLRLSRIIVKVIFSVNASPGRPAQRQRSFENISASGRVEALVDSDSVSNFERGTA